MQLSVLAIYLLIVLSISYRASKRTSDAADYLLGSRQFGAYVTALGAGATELVYCPPLVLTIY